MNPPPAPASFDGDAAPIPRKRHWLAYLGVLLLIVLIVGGLWPRALPVESVLASRGSLMVTIDEEGQTRVINRYVISSPVAGHLRRIELRPGAPVTAGLTAVAVLETSGADLLDASAIAQAQARVRGAESAREQAAAQQERAAASLALARAELERTRQLAGQGIISQRDLDIAITRERTAAQEERAAGFGLSVAEHELEQARAILTRGAPDAGTGATLEITSPITGRVLRVMQESARPVTPGLPLLEVGDPTDLEVRIEVLSRDGVAIETGARVILEQWGGSNPLEARVRLVEPAAFTKVSALGVEEQRVYVIADFVDPADTRASLGDGYRVEARIVRWSSDETLQVPAGALFQREGIWQTFVIEGGRARLRTVTPGHSNGVQTEIVDGLAEGEEVIVYPGDRVDDGSRVRGITVDAAR